MGLPDPSAAPVVTPAQPAHSRGAVRRITSAVAISALGSWSYNVAIAVYAYDRTHSATWVAAATVGRYVPALFLTWIGSSVVDRLPRRTVAVAADASCAILMAVLTLVAALSGPLVLAIALAAVCSSVARLQSAAALAVISDVEVESQLMRTASVLSTAESVATAAGPAIASLILLVARPWAVFGFNAVTFAVSAALLVGVRVAAATAPAAHRPAHVDPAAFEGTYRQVRPLIIVRAAVAFVYGFDVVVLALLATRMTTGAGGYGWLLAAAGAGGLAAAVVIRRRRRDDPLALVVACGAAAYTLPLALFALAPDLAGAIAIELARGVGAVAATSAVLVALQVRVPSEHSGRIFGRLHSMTLAGTSLGALAAPLLVHTLSLDTTVVVGALAPFVVIAALLPRLGGDVVDGQASTDVDLLRQLTLFQDANRWTLAELARGAQRRGVSTGTRLIRQGEQADAIYVIVDGAVEVTADRDGGEVHLRAMEGPCYVGEIGVLHGIARTASVTAAANCTVWRIDAAAFLAAAAGSGISGALSDTATLRLETR